MARTTISAVTVTRLGVVVPAAVAGDVANGNVTPNDGHVVLIVKNTDTVSHNLTVATARSVDGLTGPTRQTAIAASTTMAFGQYPTSDYGASLNYNVDNALLTVQALEISQA